ncbi:hypothetical protein BaRGS_00026610 [Batillaria attramentaria]|uniref:aconitate hydratase n=1 Tax=Batillaria attramentaria TaxID=370345 RepID=A0ABD0K5F0_9CAEN
MATSGSNPFSSLIQTLKVGTEEYRYFDITQLGAEQLSKLPFSVRVLLESAVRNCDNFHVNEDDVRKILAWSPSMDEAVEIPFKPARVILQDFTGVPVVVDFAAMREAVKRLGGDPQKINPICPADLVIDHSVQVDVSRSAHHYSPNPGGGPTSGAKVESEVSADALEKNQQLEFERNKERFAFLKVSPLYQGQSPISRPVPNVKVSPLCQGQSPISRSVPYIKVSPLCQGQSPISRSVPYVKVSPQYQGQSPISRSVPYVKVSPLYQGQSPVSRSVPCIKVPYIKVSPLYQNQSPISESVPCTKVSPNIKVSPLYQGHSPVSKSVPYMKVSPLYQGQPPISRSVPYIKASPQCEGQSPMSRSVPYIKVSPLYQGQSPMSRSVPNVKVSPLCQGQSPISRSVPYIKVSPLCQGQSPISRSVPNIKVSPLPQGTPLSQAQSPTSRSPPYIKVNPYLKWGAQALQNMLIVPPGSGIVHQVNLEYLARVTFNEDGLVYPDSVVGTDSHTTMINGLGVLGWGVGGIEAEAVMLGQPISMVLPEVVGYKLTGQIGQLVTSTDIVLTITKHLRQVGVVGKFVEFFGPGVAYLSIADRATISNMCPEYGATTGFFPVDKQSLAYLTQTGRDQDKIQVIENYLRAAHMFRDYSDATQDPVFSQVGDVSHDCYLRSVMCHTTVTTRPLLPQVVELDLSTVVPCCSGPKLPHDKVPVSDMKTDFQACLNNKVGRKGYAIPADRQGVDVPFLYEGQEYTLRHGSVVIAAITSCTNTSNPSVMLGAGLLAKKAVEAGLTVKPYIKTSLSPGSGVVTYYLRDSGVTDYLQKLGFDIVGYGCMTCIGNSGPLPEEVGAAIEKGDLVACGVLSGNRNFEGRIHPLTRANYLASPPLVIAYALAGTVCIDFESEPLGTGVDGRPVYLRDIWPTRSEIQEVERRCVVPAMFQDVYSRISKGNQRWNSLDVPESELYPWDPKSTYIKNPPFFDSMTRDVMPAQAVKDAYVLLHLGDSVTTDHISPAGSIARNSAAARYLSGRGLVPREFNSYGSRRGHDEVMARGTFANIRLVNKFLTKAGPRTIHIPTGQELDVYDAAMLYKGDNQPVIILAGKEYGSGSSRDWAAKGPWILGVRAVIAESYERIHRSNLVGMGVLPLQYLPGQTADTLALTGRETFSIAMPDKLTTGQILDVQLGDGRSFQVKARFDTEVELTYFQHGGILNYMVRRML